MSNVTETTIRIMRNVERAQSLLAQIIPNEKISVREATLLRKHLNEALSATVSLESRVLGNPPPKQG